MGPTKSNEAGTVWNIELVLEVRGVTSCKANDRRHKPGGRVPLSHRVLRRQAPWVLAKSRAAFVRRAVRGSATIGIFVPAFSRRVTS